MIVVDILVALLVGLGLVLALLLVVPLSYRAVGAIADDDASGHVRVAWGWGVVALRADGDGLALRVLGLRVWRRSWRQVVERAARRGRREQDEGEEREGKRGRGLRWFLRKRRVLARIAGRYLRALHLRGEVSGVVGLAQPDATAALYQLLAVAEQVLPDGTLAVEIDWLEEVVELDLRIKGWLSPLQLVGLTLWLLIDGDGFRALRAVERTEEV